MDQLTEQIMKLNSDIAVLKRDTKTAHKRIDKNDRMIESMHKLASSLDSLATQMKIFTNSMEGSVERLEGRLKNQGERIGALEKEPADRWKTLIAQITALIVAALVGGIFVKLV